MRRPHNIPLFFLFLAFFAVFHTLAWSKAAQAQSPDQKYVSIRLLPEKTSVKGGDTVTVGIEHTLYEGWHTYWKNPGDSGTAARVEWSGLEGIEASAFSWPIPHKMPMGPLVNFGYEEKAVLLQDITLPKTLPDGPITLSAKVDVLVCHDICIPETHVATMTLNGDQYPASQAVDFARARLPIDMGWETSITENADDLVVTVNTDSPSAFTNLKSVSLYPEEWGLIDNTTQTTATLDGNVLTLRHKRGDRPLTDVPVSKLVITYEMPTGEKAGVRVSTLMGGEIAPQGEGFGGFAKAILFAILGGIILNLMPCVFPVLSMKALSLVHLKGESNKTAQIHGLAYMAGVILSFVVIAGILIAIKAAGAQVGWGFQLQNPAVTLALTYLFFTLGLNLAGFFDVAISLSHAGDSLTRRHGLEGSFFTGVLATLVATPCTAPFMAGALGYALTQPPYIALLIFVFLGFGLSLPYLVLSFVPTTRHWLPRPGLWMEQFRQFLSFPMFLAACWLLWVLSQQINHMGQFAAILGMLAIAFAIWAFKTRPKNIGGKAIFLTLSALAMAFMVSTFFVIHLEDSVSASGTKYSKEDKNWDDFTRIKLDDALKGDAPVFVNMTAAWCITCKVNEKVALSVEDTKTLFKTMGITYLKGDWTNQNPEITNFLEEYGRSGVPLYVYYAPRDKQTGIRPEPVVLPQILTPDIVKETLTPKAL